MTARDDWKATYRFIRASVRQTDVVWTPRMTPYHMPALRAAWSRDAYGRNTGLVTDPLLQARDRRLYMALDAAEQ